MTGVLYCESPKQPPRVPLWRLGWSNTCLGRQVAITDHWIPDLILILILISIPILILILVLNPRRPHSVRRFPGPFIAGEGIDIDRRDCYFHDDNVLMWIMIRMKMNLLSKERARGSGGVLEGREPVAG